MAGWYPSTFYFLFWGMIGVLIFAISYAFKGKARLIIRIISIIIIIYFLWACANLFYNEFTPYTLPDASFEFGKNSKFLEVDSIETRFTDIYTFIDAKEGLESYRSQDLGCWSKDINNAYVTRGSLSSTNVCIQNNDFIKLKDKAKNIEVTLGGDFFIYSDTKSIKNEWIKGGIPIN
jgi:hypothetical protein